MKFALLVFTIKKKMIARKVWNGCGKDIIIP